ncbi:ABC transporter ATP-binding protein [Mycoplasmopsis californica HAZ160_1]|uniref:ABC transporter ATP-binding protein n=1 Tax=Mycoplasmopsis californica HAZ160_1 TaxID=1397850 RepID=A0AAT9F8C8_9BACT|nr:ATP-binding cassette domain-containing protein [Mycoplasmopsis californica]BAP01148.1 ABC transporter ATP-binding protein [Mycoplasmopsis californica HAZ160_1]BBG41014.1 ABC transporter ATP-binding protein [Mycoplasmopsis californica]BBG41607.1 ABC transporter ATP-binding protein [Mycoplasmopsis californica]BBG42201.1 ABC transporter ATP-binding protein [Mycoplasmopsis californica]BBG42783.1 ABC transporter ATP-binding protein [Mycoplasmopsis californica]
MNKNIIELNSVNLQYKTSQNSVLSNLNLQIQPGEMVAIVGPSGIGKSTLFKALVRAVKVQNGTIKLFGKNIYDCDRNQWKKIIKKIGFLTQKPNLINTEDVYDNIKRNYVDYKNFIFKIFSIIANDQKIKIFEILDSLGILDKAFYRVSELSGGQQQRIEIAKLLIRDVDIVLADEPTSNLDNQTSEEVLTLLKKMNKMQKTILVITHDLSFIKTHFNRVIVINNSTITIDKKTSEIEEWELKKAIQKTT